MKILLAFLASLMRRDPIGFEATFNSLTRSSIDSQNNEERGNLELGLQLAEEHNAGEVDPMLRVVNTYNILTKITTNSERDEQK